MIWTVCMILSYIVLVCIGALALISFFTKNRIDKLGSIAFAGVFIADIILFLPCYVPMFNDIFLGSAKALLASIHNVIRLFLVDGEITFVIDRVLQSAPVGVQSPYIVLTSILFICSPIFTFGFILSFFKSISAHNHYLFGYRKEKYFFSALNDSTIALAEDIRRHYPKALIIFADTDEKNLDSEYDYADRLKKIRAVCFRNDIANLNIALGSNSVQVRVFLFSLDENANHKQAAILCNKFSEMKNLWLYVHSVQTDSELMLSQHSAGANGKKSDIKIRPINDVRLLINNILYNEGQKIFDTAAPSGSDGEKHISALIVGMGSHGTELLKSLPYFCQMDGYRPYLYATDISKDSESIFRAACPELMDEKHNGDFTTVGEAHCQIKFFTQTDVRTQEFIRMVEKIPELTYVFISLGSDSLNITNAKLVRRICERRGQHPLIQAVVYDSDNTEILEKNRCGGKERFDIEFVGDIKRFYTEEVIMASELEQQALQRHLKWGEEEDFWGSEYNYKSSVASAIHHKMKICCKIPQIELSPDKRTEPHRTSIRILEHRRWSAYMRSEGYVYGEKKDHDMKTHYDLIPFFELPEKTQQHDDD